MPDVDNAIRHLRAVRAHLEKAEAALTREDPAELKVLDALVGETALRDLVKTTGLSETAVAQACSRMARRGDLQRVRHGVYARRAA